MMAQKYCGSIICIASSPRTGIAAPQPEAPVRSRSLDHLVGAGEHFEAEHPCGLVN
jgi:hypothetical protein